MLYLVSGLTKADALRGASNVILSVFFTFAGAQAEQNRMGSSGDYKDVDITAASATGVIFTDEFRNSVVYIISMFGAIKPGDTFMGLFFSQKQAYMNMTTTAVTTISDVSAVVERDVCAHVHSLTHGVGISARRFFMDMPHSEYGDRFVAQPNIAAPAK